MACCSGHIVKNTLFNGFPIRILVVIFLVPCHVQVMMIDTRTAPRDKTFFSFLSDWFNQLRVYWLRGLAQNGFDLVYTWTSFPRRRHFLTPQEKSLSFFRRQLSWWWLLSCLDPRNYVSTLYDSKSLIGRALERRKVQMFSSRRRGASHTFS